MCTAASKAGTASASASGGARKAGGGFQPDAHAQMEGHGTWDKLKQATERLVVKPLQQVRREGQGAWDSLKKATERLVV